MIAIDIINPFDFSAEDHIIPLSLALQPEHIQGKLAELLVDHKTYASTLKLKQISVTRYKPRKRCIVEYTFEYIEDCNSNSDIVIIGKIGLARQIEQKSFDLQLGLTQNGFHDDSSDGISVPHPIGVLPECRMWLQLKYSGSTLGNILDRNIDSNLAKNIAIAAHKIHNVNLPTFRNHFINDEMRILHDRLERVIHAAPQWRNRLIAIYTAAEKLAATLPPATLCGIHRDFYPDQILVHKERLYLLDFDLYSIGDPNLDIGNFIAHVTEYSLRKYADYEYLQEFETTLIETIVALSNKINPQAIMVYSILTLVRHIYISTLHRTRQKLTPDLLFLCEEKLAVKSKNRVTVLI